MKSEITVNELRPNCLQRLFKGYFPSLVYFFLTILVSGIIHEYTNIKIIR